MTSSKNRPALNAGDLAPDQTLTFAKPARSAKAKNITLLAGAAALSAGSVAAQQASSGANQVIQSVALQSDGSAVLSLANGWLYHSGPCGG